MISELTTPDNGRLQPATSIPTTNASRFRPADELFDTGQASRVFDDDDYTLEDIQDRQRRESIWYFPSSQCTDIDFDSSSSRLVVGLKTLVVQPHFFDDDDGYTLEDTQDRKRREPMGYTSCVQCMEVNFDSSSQLVVGLNMLVVQPHRYQDDPIDKLFPAGYEMLPDVFDTLYLSPDYKPFNAVQP